MPFQLGVTPPVVASEPKVTSTVPVEWVWEVGTTWHSVQAMAWRWSWWVPTARVVVSVSPRLPLGGAEASCGLIAVA